MKIQCSCGTKYAFEVTPEMARQPQKFVCPNCGLDSSDFVNELIRREFAGQTPDATPAPPATPAVESSRLKISRTEQPVPPSPPATTAETSDAPKFCPKHLREPVASHCVVCQKPICKKCMELFGYVCSPFCKAKAEAQGIEIPFYAGQTTAVEARFWRKSGGIFAGIATILLAAFGLWIWYAWFGSVPHSVFSVRFDKRSYSGSSQLVGKDQIVFLHGGILARYDLKNKKQIWSQELVTQQQVADAIKREDDETTREKLNGGDGFRESLPPERREALIRMGLAGALSLHISGQNIWIGSAEKLTHYDWDTGKVLQEVQLPKNVDEFISQSDELVSVDETEVGAQFVTRVNLANGESHTDEFHQPGIPVVASAQNASGTPLLASTRANNNSAASGLPLNPAADGGKPLDPATVAAQAQSLPLPARIALPATLASSANQERLMAELKDDDNPGESHPHSPTERPKLRQVDYFTLIPSEYGDVQFSKRLLEARFVSREAMKAPPKKSALDGDLTVAKTADVANETLNEMQRNRGGDTVTEDESRYQVSLRRPETTTGISDWTGEVVGPPALYALKTVNVLAAGKTVIVFDKTNKKLWQAELTYNVAAGHNALEKDAATYGQAPCAEQGDTLYVFNQAVLTAFDLTTGNARWRLPSIGVVGLFFDDKNNVYVNTTTANPENVKYSRQIDITQKIDAILLKIDSQTGRTLWSAKPGGFISYLAGKFIYTVQSYDPNPTDEPVLSDTMSGLEKPPYLRIARINPKNGRVMWEYYQDRCPIDVQFKDNSIELIFKKEVQVLKYLSL